MNKYIPKSQPLQIYNQQLDIGHPTVHLKALQASQEVEEQPFQ